MASGLPDWADFFRNAAELERFEKAVEKDFRRRGARVAIEDGRVIPVKPPSQARWGLSNLGQQCAASPPGQWPAIIARHFDTILASQPEENLCLAEAAPRLMVRLWDERDLDPKVPCVSREDIPGIRTVLCIDGENSIQTVAHDDAARWEADPAELFMQALVNVRNRVTPSIESLEPECGVRVISSGEAFYTAALALDPERFAPQIGRYGAIVGIPTRDTLLLAPFNDVGVVESINQVIAITAGAFRDGPGSVSPRVYWYRHRRWREIPYDLTERGLEVAPPDELVDLLNRVGAG